MMLEVAADPIHLELVLAPSGVDVARVEGVPDERRDHAAGVGGLAPVPSPASSAIAAARHGRVPPVHECSRIARWRCRSPCSSLATGPLAPRPSARATLPKSLRRRLRTNGPIVAGGGRVPFHPGVGVSNLLPRVGSSRTMASVRSCLSMMRLPPTVPRMRSTIRSAACRLPPGGRGECLRGARARSMNRPAIPALTTVRRQRGLPAVRAERQDRRRSVRSLVRVFVLAPRPGLADWLPRA
jgi:hypothetical protein